MATAKSRNDIDDRSSLRKMAKDFIERNRMGSLATSDKQGNPHVATIYCIVNKDLTLYFSTRVESRKYHNLTNRPTVAMTFNNEKDMTTLQLTGVAGRIETLSIEQEILRELILIRYGEPNWPVPPVKLFEHGVTNELAIIKVVPHEMTFANFETTDKGRYKTFFQKIID